MAATQKKTESKGKSTRSKKAPVVLEVVYPTTARIISGVLLLLLALCVIVSYFGVEAAVLDVFARGLKGLFGYGYWLWGPVLLWSGIVLLRNQTRRLTAQLICTMLLPLFFGMILHLFLCRDTYAFAVADMKILWAAGQEMTAGGVIAGAVAAGCIAGFSKVVSAIVFIVVTLVLLVIALHISPKEMAQKMKERAVYEEEKPVPDEEQFMAAKSAKMQKPRKQFPIDIPLDGEKRNREKVDSPLTQVEKKPFFREKDANILTPAEALDPNAAPVSAPVAEKPKHRRTVQASTEEVATATAEVSQAIEKELSEEEGTYQYPPITLLEENNGENYTEAGAELRSNAQRLANTLASFNVDAQPGDVIRGPSVTRYEFTLDQGVKLSKLTNLADDIALALGASGVRIAPVPNKISAVGIEVPNRAVTSVRIRDVIESKDFTTHKSTTAFAVGKDIGGNCIIGNIGKLPHVLIAGTTGSGKSVCTNSLIVSLLYKSTPDEVRFIMVDPKMVELAPYNGIPHLLIPVVTDPKKAAGALQWAVFEMMKRYKMFSEKGVKDLAGYNALCENPMTAEEDMKKLPSVVVVIDELADLMLVAAKEVEESICRVAQMGRAAGVHLVIATQRPSADVITGLMKANIPSRIAFAVASAMESRIILDTTGAEKLVGKGDMLYFPLGDSKPTRVQGCFISPEEIERVVAFVKDNGEVQYDQTVMDKIEEALKKDDKGAMTNSDTAGEGGDYDELLGAAVDVVLETGQASVSMLQRRLKLGYSRAARLVDQMEERGIVGPFEGSKPRQLLITKAQWQEMQMKGTAPGSEPEEEVPAHDPYGSIRDVFDSRDALD